MCVLDGIIVNSQREIVMIRSYRVILEAQETREVKSWSWARGPQHRDQEARFLTSLLSSPPRHGILLLDCVKGDYFWIFWVVSNVPQPWCSCRLSLAQAGKGAPPGLLPSPAPSPAPAAGTGVGWAAGPGCGVTEVLSCASPAAASADPVRVRVAVGRGKL